MRGTPFARIGELANGGAAQAPPEPPTGPPAVDGRAREAPPRPRAVSIPADADGDGLHPAARKLLTALAQHAPGRFSWGQAATLAGLKPSGGHFNAGRKQLRDGGLVEETPEGLAAASAAGLDAAGVVPPAPSTPRERLELWCARLPSPAPEMLRALAARGGDYIEPAELAAALGKKPSGGHWNSRVAVLRNNGLIELDGKRVRAAEPLRESAA